MAEDIKRNLGWTEKLGGPTVLTFALTIVSIPGEAEADTTQRFLFEAIRIVQAFLAEQGF